MSQKLFDSLDTAFTFTERMEPDRVPFLPQALDDVDEKTSRAQFNTPRSRPSKHFCIAAGGLQILLILLYTVVLFAILKFEPNNSSLPEVQIDNLVIQYKSQVQSLSDWTYKGLPSPEVDAAWDKLMAPMNIRVTEEELERSNQKSVSLPGGGKLAWIGAFHQLHCVRLLRHVIDIDYYAPNSTAEDIYHLKSHGNHCLEMLRQSAMCGGDTSLTTFSWNEGKRRASVNPVGYSLQTCVDWDSLLASMADRTVDRNEFESLVNPLDLGD